MGNSNVFKRNAGILMAISSLPSPYGIGTLGKDAYEFVDFVRDSNHKYWQVLPVGPTTYGDSPYQPYSAFAGNPYFVDLDMLIEEGLLLKSEVIAVDWGDGIIPVEVSEDDAVNNRYPVNHDGYLGDDRYVSYEKMYNERFNVLRKAYERFKGKCVSAKLTLDKGLPLYKRFDNFVKDNAYWLKDYAMFMSLKEYFNQKAWGEWDRDIKFREPEAMQRYEDELSDDIGFWNFIQYEFYTQWGKLKAYANSNGIEIIGDIPIYMGYDSVDVWANQAEFQLDENLTPVKVAGVPPDAFSDMGQKWGNPLYDWAKMENSDFGWWRMRMANSARLYDIIRIDHFLGIIKYYTNITFTEKQLENPAKIYDLLNSNNVINNVIAAIPSNEYDEIRTGIEDTIKSIYQYQNSALGILDTIGQDYSDLNLEADTISEKLSNPDNMKLLRDVLAKLG